MPRVCHGCEGEAVSSPPHFNKLRRQSALVEPLHFCNLLLQQYINKGHVRSCFAPNKELIKNEQWRALRFITLPNALSCLRPLQTQARAGEPKPRLHAGWRTRTPALQCSQSNIIPLSPESSGQDSGAIFSQKCSYSVSQPARCVIQNCAYSNFLETYLFRN